MDKKYIPIIVIIFAAIIGLSGVIVFKDQLFSGKDNETKEKVTSKKESKSDLKMEGNSLSDFDLAFLKLENGEVNKVYSPLSIKYALEMLSEGADGNTKTQLDAVIGNYVARKYTNGKNMSFANGLFVRDSFKDDVKTTYIDTLKDVYGAEVYFDGFSSPKVVNQWVSDKTFKLIPDLFDDVSSFDYILVNALAIDMEWVNKIQSEHVDYEVNFAHEQVEADPNAEYPHDYDSGAYVSSLDSSGYHNLKFNGKENIKSVEISAVANKFDIISELGEEDIKSTVLKEYNEWKKTVDSYELQYDTFDINEYMKELKGNYGHVSSSTDFLFYDDEDVKVFAKDLRTYDGTTLQYVGIMPKKDKLSTFVDNMDSKKINGYISGLKDIESDSFEDGYITIVEGYIPMFDFEYELDLMEDLKKLGITDVFDSEKSDLSNLSSSDTYIDSAVHKANIEFSNDGIKAAAATAMGGKGGIDMGFEYRFTAPVKRINLTFDNPYMYLVRDKDTGEVWFAGTVYEPKQLSSADNYPLY